MSRTGRSSMALGLLLTVVMLVGCTNPIGTDSSASTNLNAGREDVSGGEEVDREAKQSLDDGGCPGVESGLLQILTADQPAMAAEGLGYPVKDGRIQVVLTIAGEKLDSLNEWDVQIGTFAGDQLQILAYPDDVCAIAASDWVNFIRLPSIAVPQ